VIRDSNPLRDPLNEIESSSSSAASDKDDEEEEEEEWGGIDSDSPEEAARKERKRPLVVRELERLANQSVEKPERHQSEREREWLERLVARHGDDASAMAKDAKLNPMQQTAADLKKRLRKAGLLS
jgi:nucleolar protein 16